MRSRIKVLKKANIMDDCGAGNMPGVLESCLVDFFQAGYADLNR